MARRDSLGADVFQPLWAAGWQWQWIVAGGLFLGGYVLVSLGETVQGAGIGAFSVALAAVGIWYVGRTYESVLDAGVDRAQSAVADLTGFEADDVDVYTTLADGRSLAFVRPPREYAITTILVAEEGFVVHDDGEISLAHRYYRVGDDATRFDYASVDAVEYEDGELGVTREDGTTETWSLSTEPGAALTAIRERLRASPTA